MRSLPVYNTPEGQVMGKMTQSKARRKTLIYLGLILCMSWGAFILFFHTKSSTLATTMDDSPIKPESTNELGINARPGFKDMIQVADLPSKLIPETGKHRKSGRLLVVGDVHGMKEALQDLLVKVKFDEKHDHLILAGDMVSKGQDSAGVVDLAMKLGATGIRGNHEDRIILTHADMVEEHAVMDPPGPSEEAEKKDDALEELSYSHGDYKDRALVKQLGEKRIQWLKMCPVILRVGHLEDMGEVVVVHAGLAPGVKLEKQDPSMVMNMRTIDEDGLPSDEREGSGWWKAWNKYQKNLPRKERTTVIYGHDSKRGLQTEKYSMGIDTGCLKGGKLTAVVIEGGHSDHSQTIVDVKCKDGRHK